MPGAPNSFLCAAHEERIQQQEALSQQLAAAQAASEVKFEMIRDSIKGLSDHLTKSVERLERTIEAQNESVQKRLDVVEQKQDEHQNLLATLGVVEKAREVRREKMKKVAIAILLPAAGAFATEFGGAVWKWFAGIFAVIVG